jgi:hypothetical protein
MKDRSHFRTEAAAAATTTTVADATSTTSATTPPRRQPSSATANTPPRLPPVSPAATIPAATTTRDLYGSSTIDLELDSILASCESYGDNPISAISPDLFTSPTLFVEEEPRVRLPSYKPMRKPSTATYSSSLSSSSTPASAYSPPKRFFVKKEETPEVSIMELPLIFQSLVKESPSKRRRMN